MAKYSQPWIKTEWPPIWCIAGLVRLAEALQNPRAQSDDLGDLGAVMGCLKSGIREPQNLQIPWIIVMLLSYVIIPTVWPPQWMGVKLSGRLYWERGAWRLRIPTLEAITWALPCMSSKYKCWALQETQGMTFAKQDETSLHWSRIQIIQPMDQDPQNHGNIQQKIQTHPATNLHWALQQSSTTGLLIPWSNVATADTTDPSNSTCPEEQWRAKWSTCQRLLRRSTSCLPVMAAMVP